jgi:leader peptidase (prepilin peptidase)/N-methyltransferase
MAGSLAPATLAALFGLIIGSFLNVVIYRLPREGMSIVRPRSRCPQCGHQLAWYENLPIVSWLLQGGRCRSCRAGIPLRYPLVELLTAVLFFLSFVRLHPTDDPLALGFVRAAALAALVAVSYIDFDHRIIPDEISIPGMVLAPIACLFVPALMRHEKLYDDVASATNEHVAGLALSLAGAVVGAGIIWGVGFLGRLVFKKEAMGFGDVKLMGLIGGLVGPEGVFLAFLIGVVSGAFFGIAYFLVTRDRYIPFGPFLALGGGALLLWGAEVRHFFWVTYPGLFR